MGFQIGLRILKEDICDYQWDSGSCSDIDLFHTLLLMHTPNLFLLKVIYMINSFYSIKNIQTLITKSTICYSSKTYT